jgi:mitochondrial pyruvate carrier 1
MRYALAVTPKNYLLFACHFINFNSQVYQGYRWYDYWHMGGKNKWDAIRANAKSAGKEVEGEVKGIAEKAKEAVKS